MALLTQFLLRLTFGLAVGMAITPRQVSSGFFRNHLYVTLGTATLAALVSYAAAPAAFWWAIGAAVASYAGSVCWLYEKQKAGQAALWLVAMVSLGGALALTASAGVLPIAANVSSGLLLGLTTAAMLLGHWYLNAPGMELAPLRRLLLAVGAAVVLQAVVSAAGLACELHYAAMLSSHWWLFVLLRWAFGLAGVAVLAWMAWQTLKVPNTQSATGILYVAVIGVFVGELAAALLSAESAFPL